MARPTTVVRNTIWNLVGIASPMFVGIYSIPRVIAQLGAERFGILTLAWTMAGYFSIFDLGLGRALTHAVAQRKGTGRDDAALAAVAHTGLALMAILGLIAALLIAGCSDLLVRSLKVPADMRNEASLALIVLACAIPLTTLSAGLRGIAEGVNEFVSVNIVRAALGAATLAGPLAALRFSHSLVSVMAVLVISRALTTAAYGILALKHLPELRSSFALSTAGVGPLLRFGGWTTVSNVVGPILSNADRFFLASIVSLASVAYYTTPYEMVSKLLVVPAALIAVLFPAFTSNFQWDRQRVAQLYRRAARVMGLGLVPVTIAVVALAYPLLSLWLGGEFARNSYRALQLLACGVLFNALAYLPSTLIQASGRPDLPAKLNLMEMVVYLPCLLFVLPRYGIEGAAFLWMLRMLIDMALMFLAASRILESRGSVRPLGALGGALVLVALGCAMVPYSIGGKLLVLSVSILVWIPVAWVWLLDGSDRAIIINALPGWRTNA